jgi:hypothetical protein
MPAIPVSQCPTRSNQVPGHLSRLVTFHCQKVMQWQLDLFWIFILAPLKEGTSHEEEAQPNALAPDHLQWLWKHSDCYNLQKEQMRATEMVQVILLSTRRPRDEALWSIRSLPILLWFPRRLQSAWISLSGSRSSRCWERHSQHYTMHGEKIIMILWRRQVSWIHRGCLIQNKWRAAVWRRCTWLPATVMPVCTASLILQYGFMAHFGIFNYHWNPYIASTFP